MDWRFVVKDKYPAYIDWATFEKIQAMLRDNRAEYLRNKSRGIPRDGAALLHGITWCGECGHKMVVRYKGGSQYVCNHLRQQHDVPVCQCLRAAPIDAQVAAHSLKPSRPQKSMHYHGPARRSFRQTKHYGTPRNDKFSDCATRRRSPSVSSTVSIRITGSWPASLSGVGRRLSSNYAAQKKRWHDGRTQLRRRLSALIPACGQRW